MANIFQIDIKLQEIEKEHILMQVVKMYMPKTIPEAIMLLLWTVFALITVTILCCTNNCNPFKRHKKRE
jgi:hypothetical protein